MAAINTTAAQVRPVYVEKCTIRSRSAAAAINAGQAVYYTTSGTAGLCNAADSGKEQFEGIALDSVGSGETLRILEDGWMYGADLSGVNYALPVYVKDTAGGLDNTVSSTKTVYVGRVDFINDSSKTKILHVLRHPAAAW